MENELDPNATEQTTGDPGDPGAESDAGTQGEGDTVAELQAQLAEMQRREELLLRTVSRGGSRAAAEAPVYSPTAPDPRAEGALRENENKKAALRAEVARLADQGDAASRYALQQAQDRLDDLNSIGTALRHVYGELQELKAERGLPESERDAWSAWYNENRGDYNSVKAARLAYEGHKALEATKAPKVAPTNGGGKTAPAYRAPAARQKVDISLRPMGADDTRRTVAKMTGDDFDAQLAAMHSAGDHAGARALQSKMLAGELDVTD